jgi:hypothetical protein
MKTSRVPTLKPDPNNVGLQLVTRYAVSLQIIEEAKAASFQSDLRAFLSSILLV